MTYRDASRRDYECKIVNGKVHVTNAQLHMGLWQRYVDALEIIAASREKRKPKRKVAK